jgi:hypothetical protein
MKRYALFSGYGWTQTKLMHHDCKTKKEAIIYFRDCYPSMHIGDNGKAQSGDVLYEVKEQFEINS